MIKLRTIQENEGTRQAPVKQVLLEIIQNRTGSVSSDEIYGALRCGWELPELPNPRRWVAVMLAEMAKLGFITKTGTHTKKIGDGLAGAAVIAMYDIAPAGTAFLAAGGGVVPKYKPASPPVIDEGGTLIPRDGLSSCISSGWAVPRCTWRKRIPAAAHMYNTGAQS
jgi:hypothetical protein